MERLFAHARGNCPHLDAAMEQSPMPEIHRPPNYGLVMASYASITFITNMKVSLVEGFVSRVRKGCVAFVTLAAKKRGLERATKEDREHARTMSDSILGFGKYKTRYAPVTS